MNVKIEKSWQKVLIEEFEKDYFKKLANIIRSQYTNQKIFPPPKNIFRAFELCPFEKTKVVILGQDPYHGAGQANGLSFSVNEGVSLPPSLQNIFKEIESDINLTPERNGNLDRWARQGVLLLNAVLTVEMAKPTSHQNMGWEIFTDAVIKKLSDEKENLVFILWGNYAKEKGKVINRNKHLILESPHPSPFSAHSGFFGSKPFSKTNKYLKEKNIKEIDWK